MGEPIKPKAEPVLTFTQEQIDALVTAAAQRAATEAAAAAIAQVSARSPNETGAIDAQSLLSGLALAIAEISHQGNPKDKPVDPKVLAERRVANERMYELISQAQALPKGDPRAPKYRTRSKLMFNDVEIVPYRRDPGTKKAVPVEFRWRLEPNDAMIPLNELAEAIYAEFRGSRGNKAAYEKGLKMQGWLTDGGLYIEGTAPARREVGGPEVEDNRGDLEIGAIDDPNATSIRVLGTNHAPARQTASGVFN